MIWTVVSAPCSRQNIVLETLSQILLSSPIPRWHKFHTPQSPTMRFSKCPNPLIWKRGYHEVAKKRQGDNYRIPKQKYFCFHPVWKFRRAFTERVWGGLSVLILQLYKGKNFKILILQLRAAMPRLTLQRTALNLKLKTEKKKWMLPILLNMPNPLRAKFTVTRSKI